MKGNRFLKVILWIIAIVAIIALSATIALYSYLKFFIMPKINQSNNEIGILDIAKEFSDKQIIDNIINFDKQSAIEILTAITELNEENVHDELPQQQDSNTENKDTVPDKENKTAYERIVNEASEYEISQGAAILAKLDMAKINELRKKGNTAAIKAYIKSVLSPSEISTALKLYNKYKHLL